MVDLRVATTIGEDTVLEEATVETLKASLRGELLCRVDAGYDDARKVWNGMIDRKPGLIIRCTGAADVITAVNLARTNNLLVSVHGGGHNIAGNAVCEGGLMIDLSGMKGIRVEPTNRTVRAEPGLTWGEFDRETQAFGLATPGGQVSTTGIAGVTLGGGWGWLSRKYGLTIDNLLSVDIITADGQLRTASVTENTDLFWGIRGGGGNFGIVTSFEYQLHPVGPMVAGMMVYPFEQAKDVLHFYRDFAKTAPEEFVYDVVLITMPDGTSVIGAVVCYSGPIEEGERVLQPLKALGSPLMEQIGRMAYVEFQTIIDDFYPSGLHSYWKSSFLPEVSDDVIETMVAYCSDRPSPMSHGLIEQQLGGAVSRMDRDATAFNHRDVVYSFMSLAVWTDPTESEKCIRWAREFWEAMQPFTAGSVYVNYLGQEVHEGADRVKAAYGPKKFERLVALKNKYDSTNLFRMNQNIKPAV
ncbi:MAG: FAD-binding oxidoreductase [bacterium]|nr:FAD-binding oxidoreductase [bacterium]